MRTRSDILDRAQRHLGHRETGENRSPLIDAWLRRCHLGPGYAWCAAFASWCITPDEQDLGVRDTACAGAIRLGHLFPATAEPMPGDLMWFISDHVKGTGHVGIVVAGDGEQVLCIEGNSENQIRYVRRMRSEVYFSRTRDEEMPLPPITFKAAPLVHVKKDGTR